MLEGFYNTTTTFCWNAYRRKIGSHALLQILLTSVYCCNSLEAHLLHHRFEGIRGRPFSIKADRKPGNWDGAQVRYYYKADLQSLHLKLLAFFNLVFICSCTVRQKRNWKNSFNDNENCKIRPYGFPGFIYIFLMQGFKDTTQSLILFCS